MVHEMTFSVRKEDSFQHIVTKIPVEKWDEIKAKYHETKNHSIEGFAPILFYLEELGKEKVMGELISTLLEGRKYKKIALVHFTNDEEWETVWKLLNKGHQGVIGFNASYIG